MLGFIKKMIGWLETPPAPARFVDQVDQTATTLSAAQDKLEAIRKDILHSNLENRLELADDLLYLAEDLQRASVKVLRLTSSAFDMVSEIRVDNRLYF